MFLLPESIKQIGLSTTKIRWKHHFLHYKSIGVFLDIKAGAQFEGDLCEILALGAEISPYIGLKEKWESP